MSLAQLTIPANRSDIALRLPMTAKAHVQLAELYIMAIYEKRFALPADFPAAIEFEWDPGNSMKNEKHTVSDAEAEQVFFNEPLLVLEDSAHSASESRWHALGRTNEDRLLQVAFTLRVSGTRVRIISARPMHRKERKIYDQAAQGNP